MDESKQLPDKAEGTILLSDSLAKKFRIRGYPTNMLILPDGKRCVRASQVTQQFFQNYTK